MTSIFCSDVSFSHSDSVPLIVDLNLSNQQSAVSSQMSSVSGADDPPLTTDC